MDALIRAQPGRRYTFFKTTPAAKSVGGWTDGFATATLPATGTLPAANSVAFQNPLTVATPGAFPILDASAGANYISRVSVGKAANVGSFFLYDRLVQVGRLLDTGTTNTFTSVPSLPSEYSTGEDVEIWLTWGAASGGTASNIQVTYTNQAGTGSKVTPALAMQAASVVNQLQILPLAAGDTGVRSIQSNTLSASMVGSGWYVLSLVRRLAEVTMTGAPGEVVTFDALTLGLPKLRQNACLCIAYQALVTTGSTVMGYVDVIEG